MKTNSWPVWVAGRHYVQQLPCMLSYHPMCRQKCECCPRFEMRHHLQLFLAQHNGWLCTYNNATTSLLTTSTCWHAQQMLTSNLPACHLVSPTTQSWSAITCTWTPCAQTSSAPWCSQCQWASFQRSSQAGHLLCIGVLQDGYACSMMRRDDEKGLLFGHWRDCCMTCRIENLVSLLYDFM